MTSEGETTRALLIYNPNAGGGAEDQARILQTELLDQGYQPVYRATRKEAELDDVLLDANGLVVVVGGDGTLRAVATRLAGKDVPLALVPNGTANNVGRTLGIEGSPVDVIRRLAHPEKQRVDLGRVRFPWGNSFFLEGAGFGLYAEALSEYRPEDGKSFLRGCQTLIGLLADAPSRRVRYRLDGVEYEDEFLLFEAMNMGAIGPRIPLAPDCCPSDGLLDLVRIKADSRDSYLNYLMAMMDGRLEELDSVEVDRVKKIEVLWDGFPVHQDAAYVDLEHRQGYRERWITIELLDEPMEFWLPSQSSPGFVEVELASVASPGMPQA